MILGRTESSEFGLFLGEVRSWVLEDEGSERSNFGFGWRTSCLLSKKRYFSDYVCRKVRTSEFAINSRVVQTCSTTSNGIKNGHTLVITGWFNSGYWYARNEESPCEGALSGSIKLASVLVEIAAFNILESDI